MRVMSLMHSGDDTWPETEASGASQELSSSSLMLYTWLSVTTTMDSP